jgi:hypothetical protein
MAVNLLYFPPPPPPWTAEISSLGEVWAFFGTIQLCQGQLHRLNPPTNK